MKNKTLVLIVFSIILNVSLFAHEPNNNGSNKKEYAKNIRKEFFKKDNLQHMCLEDYKGLKSKSLRLIEYYQTYVSPKKGFLCAYGVLHQDEPSCSEYGKQAIQEYGLVKGAFLIRKQFKKCGEAANIFNEIRTLGTKSKYFVLIDPVFGDCIDDFAYDYCCVGLWDW